MLSLQDASFVNGVFTDLAPKSKVLIPRILSDTRAWISEANTFSSFPTGVVVTGVWGVLLIATNGMEILARVRCRSEDRKRMMAGMSGGMEK